MANAHDETHEIKLQVVRDEVAGGWLNRFVKVAGSNVRPCPLIVANSLQEIEYYCEVKEESEIIFRRGGKDGHQIGHCRPCQQKSGFTDLHLNQTDHPVHYFIQLHHGHSNLRPYKEITTFTYPPGVDEYVWKGHLKLEKQVTTTKFKFIPTTTSTAVVATFHPKGLGGLLHNVGDFELTWDQDNMPNQADFKRFKDVIVLTGLIVQERADEHRLTVKALCGKTANHLPG